jgi:hypothetical protein
MMTADFAFFGHWDLVIGHLKLIQFSMQQDLP